MNFAINRRGMILGKIVTSFPVMLFIFFVIAIYIISAGFIYGIKRPPISLGIEGVELDSVLLRNIHLNIEGENADFILFDALVGSWRGNVDFSLLREAIEEMVRKGGQDNFCFALAQGENQGPAGGTGGAANDDIFIEFKGGEISSGNRGYNPLVLSKYERSGKLKEMSFSLLNDEKTIYVQYYYGKCLEGI